MNLEILNRINCYDFEKVSKDITRFISDYVSESRLSGVVIGLSGGLDSSVVVKLCADAIGKERVFGLILPSKTTPDNDVSDALSLAKSLGIEHKTINITPVVEKFLEYLPGEKKANGNLVARVRMSIIYHFAFLRKGIVAGTSDKSELCIGYFTKYGDGGADIVPIADLYKTQVRSLGRYLGIPAAVIEKKSGPRLWENHTAEEEIGVDYEMIDSILYLLVDKKITAAEIAKTLAIKPEYVDKIESMVAASAHKRLPPKIARLSWEK